MLAVLKGIRFMYWPDESSSSSASLLDLENGRLRLFDLIEISAMRPRRRYRRQEPPSQRPIKLPGCTVAATMPTSATDDAKTRLLGLEGHVGNFRASNVR